MTTYNEELVKAGIMVNAEGLQPSAKGARIAFPNFSSTPDYKAAGLKVVPGPFAEVSVAGFWVWKCADLDEAIKWASKAAFGGGSLEIRPCQGLDDMGGCVTDETRGSEKKWGEALKAKNGQ